jgi:hypothetical protein
MRKLYWVKTKYPNIWHYKTSTTELFKKLIGPHTWKYGKLEDFIK